MARFREIALATVRSKLASTRGETLVETLVATLIMALVMLMLCTAIVSAAKINASARAGDISFDQGSAEELQNLTVRVSTSHGETTMLTTENPKKIEAYTQNGYVYYEPHETSENN